MSMDEHNDLLFLSPYRNNMNGVFIQGVVLGVAESISYMLYSAGYSFGAFLVIMNRATHDQVFR